MRIGDDNQDEFFNAANDDGVMVKDVKQMIEYALKKQQTK